MLVAEGLIEEVDTKKTMKAVSAKNKKMLKMNKSQELRAIKTMEFTPRSERTKGKKLYEKKSFP